MDSILLKDVPIELLDKKRILLTGATGLVGTHFLYAFYEAYKKGVDLEVFAPQHSSLPNHLIEIANSEFMNFIGNGSFISSDIIIHASSYGQPSKFIKNSMETVFLNTTVTQTLLQNYLKPNGRFLFLSSSEVCSGLYNAPVAEDTIGTTTPYHPRACYIEAKRCGETIVNIFRENGTDAKSIRLCLAYGEGTRKDDQRVLNDLIRKALADKEIKLMDAGQAVRTYCYIGDAVNMMLKILLEGKHPVYNVGGIFSLSIAQLAYLIGKLTGSPVVLQLGSKSLEGSPDVVNMSIQRYIDEFGEREFVSIEEGLRRTIKYQRILYGNDIK